MDNICNVKGSVSALMAGDNAVMQYAEYASRSLFHETREVPKLSMHKNIRFFFA